MTAANNHHPYPTVSRRFKSILPCTVTTWQHDTREPYMHNKWPQFTMTIKESSRAHRTLVQVFHVIPRRASVGGPHTIPMSSVKYSGVPSNSAAVKATKFTGPHKSRMQQYIINLVHRGQTIGPQSTQVGSTTFGALNMKTFHSPPFPFGILHFSLVAPPSLT
jgi:hypothetical protein